MTSGVYSPSGVHCIAAFRSSTVMKNAPRLLGARPAFRRPRWIQSTMVRGDVPWPTCSAACLVVKVLLGSVIAYHSLQCFIRRYTRIARLIKRQVPRLAQECQEGAGAH